ncbi:beta-glucosidase [Nitriliruptoraceae bacterium ZYF776]|nr:beta-glucosidase [Profundirhabdus halotolerans]
MTRPTTEPDAAAAATEPNAAAAATEGTVVSETVTSDATYRDPTAPVGARVADLLARLDRTERLAQLGSVWSFQLTDGGADLVDELAEARLRDGIGHVTRILGATNLGATAAARLANAIQQHLVERTRWGIPAIVHEEVCSGVMARETTIFPQAIGVASTWDPELNRELAEVVRRQLRAVGAHQGLSPVLDVARDPRWGRTEETYGEDPYLVAQFGTAFVRGLQGDDLRDGVVATAKHFVGYGASEGGLNWAPAHLPPRELHEVHLLPFEAAVREAGLASIMHGYHELDGVPCAASRELLTELLRDAWGFTGTVVSDYFAVEQLHSYHRLATDRAHAATLALRAGIDVELPGTDCYAGPLEDALDAGAVDERHLEDAVARVLRHKFELGLFEDPYVDVAAAPVRIDTGQHRALARQVARASLVLLRNEGGLLPLGAEGGTIAVIGPNADDARNLLGDYTHPAHMETLAESRDHESTLGGMPELPDDLDVAAVVDGIPTVLEALRARFGARVRYARGCGVTDDGTDDIATASALAADAEVVVLVVGDRAGLTDACTSGEARDRSSLDLPGRQEQLAREVLATGTPVVTVLVAGRPCGSADLHERSDAVLVAWLPGQEGADAIAEVLAGEVEPSGRLPITFPRSAGHVPAYYGHKRSGGRSHWKGDYADAPVAPLHAFGAGFGYGRCTVAARLCTARVPVGGVVHVEADVSNPGDRDGVEVVQLYVRDPVASVTRPVLELKGFQRVEVPAGHQRTVRFALPTGAVGLHDRHLDYVVEPGALEVHVGTSVRALDHVGDVQLEAADPDAPPVAKAFTTTCELGPPAAAARTR